MGFTMEPLNESVQFTEENGKKKKRHFQLVKLEESIAPSRFRLQKLEERITPSATSSGGQGTWGCTLLCTHGAHSQEHSC
jgi:hypothetical protein